MQNKKILAVCATIAGMLCGVSLGVPIKSSIGADGGKFAEGWEPTAADYIQTGLVGLWDAIENTGWGEHNVTSTIWKNLMGGTDLRCGSGTVGDRWIRYSSTFLTNGTEPLVNGYEFTIEGVFDRSETTGNFCALGFGYSTGCLVAGNTLGFGGRFGTGWVNIKPVTEKLNTATWVRAEADKPRIRFFQTAPTWGFSRLLPTKR